jgi:hypothetical protein
LTFVFPMSMTRFILYLKVNVKNTIDFSIFIW